MINKYSAIVFDCDGVLLDSNRVKTNAFREVTRVYGDDISDGFVKFHLDNGGISRYRKFEYFLTDFLGQPAELRSVKELVNKYADCVCQGLLKCRVADGLDELREKSRDIPWMIVSGGDQQELNSVFSTRGLASLFDAGIYGSPESKDEIFDRLRRSGQLAIPSLFIGDSRYDHEMAEKYGIDFIFSYGWTEFSEWKNYCTKNDIKSIKSICDLLLI